MRIYSRKKPASDSTWWTCCILNLQSCQNWKSSSFVLYSILFNLSEEDWLTDKDVKKWNRGDNVFLVQFSSEAPLQTYLSFTYSLSQRCTANIIVYTLIVVFFYKKNCQHFRLFICLSVRPFKCFFILINYFAPMDRLSLFHYKLKFVHCNQRNVFWLR